MALPASTLARSFAQTMLVSNPPSHVIHQELNAHPSLARQNWWQHYQSYLLKEHVSLDVALASLIATCDIFLCLCKGVIFVPFLSLWALVCKGERAFVDPAMEEEEL
ncbi:hypothetical protein LguiA_012890 [Lonicera macranthoides]